jgi:hypothetical protein
MTIVIIAISVAIVGALVVLKARREYRRQEMADLLNRRIGR